MVWRIEYHSGIATDVAKRPLQTLYGHDDVVNTVAMMWELDIAVSGSKVRFNSIRILPTESLFGLSCGIKLNENVLISGCLWSLLYFWIT